MTLVVDVAKAFERVRSEVGDVFRCSAKCMKISAWDFHNHRRVQFEGCVVDPLQTIMATVLVAFEDSPARCKK